MLYYVAPLPSVDDEPDIPTHFEVCTLSGSVIADFKSYDDAVDLICLIEEFCESHGLKRREKLFYELQELNLVCQECDFNHDIDKCNSCVYLRKLAHIRSLLESSEDTK